MTLPRRYRRGALAMVSVLALAAVAGVANAQAIPDTLQQRIKACTSCHGKHGQGGDNGFNPRLAGKPALYLYHQLQNFRAGRRHYPMMQHMVTGLPDAYLREISDYFASQTPAWPAPEPSPLPASVLQQGHDLVEHGDKARMVPACMACHGKRLTGMEPAIPPLVGLPRDYISNQLGAWRGGTRHAIAPDCMDTVASRLTPIEITAVAAWLSTQPVPDDTKPAPAESWKLPLKCGGVTAMPPPANQAPVLPAQAAIHPGPSSTTQTPVLPAQTAIHPGPSPTTQTPVIPAQAGIHFDVRAGGFGRGLMRSGLRR